MSRTTLTVEFPFRGDDYRCVVVINAGVPDAYHDVSVMTELGAWKPVVHPSPDLERAIGEAACKYLEVARDFVQHG